MSDAPTDAPVPVTSRSRVTSHDVNASHQNTFRVARAAWDALGGSEPTATGPARDRGTAVHVKCGARASRMIDAIPANRRGPVLVAAVADAIERGLPDRATRPGDPAPMLWVEHVAAGRAATGEPANG